jgi:ABC-type uncharacterized transport system substrate-binding protein
MLGIRRREFITLLGGAAIAWPLAGHAQQPENVRRVAILMAGGENDPQFQAQVAAFRYELEKLGWAEGRNLRSEYRWRMNDVERTRTATAELLRLKPDVMLANGTPAAAAAQQATRMVPIVFTVVSEPVSQGIVQSLAHPGGNITGFTNLEPTVGGKWVELLKTIAPQVGRVALVIEPVSAGPIALAFPFAEAAAKKLAMEFAVIPVHEPAEIEATMAKLGRDPNGGVIFPTSSFINANRKLIINLAAQYWLPCVYLLRNYAADGGLVSYGIDVVDQFRLAAGYVDRILRGEKPADLPVQQPTKFQLVINLKTAKTLALEVPLTLLATADEVIE